jgi:2-oxoglutarate ferredoxin oxidoreductase subunit alpha
MNNQHEWDDMAGKVIEWDEKDCADAEVILVAHGIVARSAISACNELRAKGQKVGFFRPITLRPFPDKQLMKAIKNAKKLLVAESAYGQLLKMVQTNLFGSQIEIVPMLRPGVGITTEEIVAEYQKLS